nr:hypothetical protein KPHV_76550 [Kitasatospora purpeofusca]
MGSAAPAGEAGASGRVPAAARWRSRARVDTASTAGPPSLSPVAPAGSARVLWSLARRSSASARSAVAQERARRARGDGRGAGQILCADCRSDRAMSFDLRLP